MALDEMVLVKRILGALGASATAMALVALPAQPARAADGDLDPSFAGGTVTTAIGDAAWVGDVAVDGNGGVLVVGGTCAAQCRSVVARYLPNGSLDTTFDGDGILFGAFGAPEEATGVALQPDGDVVVVGTWAGGGFLARLQPGGALDPAFGQAGWVDTGPASTPLQVAVAPDGSIVVVGETDGGSGWRASVTRYTASGTPDVGFSGDGLVLLPGSATSWASGVAVRTDGRIVVGATELAGPAGSRIVVASLLADGALDDAFGTGGVTVVPMPERASAGRLALAEDGAIAVAGFAGEPGSVQGRVAVLRSDGTMDPNFDGDGWASLAIVGSSVSLRDVAITPRGLVVAGATSGGVGERFVVARFGRTGLPDQTFGTDGVVTTTFGGAGAGANALAMDASGGAYAAGLHRAPAYQLAVAKYAVATPAPPPGGGPGDGIEGDEETPETTIESAPDGYVAAAWVAFGSPTPGATFECAVDDAAFAPCVSPAVYEDLPDGSHRFAVRALAAGLVDPSPAEVWFWVDGSAPTDPRVRMVERPARVRYQARWRAADAASGVETFRVQLRIRSEGRATAWADRYVGGDRSRWLAAGPGVRVCVRVKAIDAAGNVSSWSPTTCVTG